MCTVKGRASRAGEGWKRDNQLGVENGQQRSRKQTGSTRERGQLPIICPDLASGVGLLRTASRSSASVSPITGAHQSQLNSYNCSHAFQGVAGRVPGSEKGDRPQVKQLPHLAGRICSERLVGPGGEEVKKPSHSPVQSP